MDDQKVYISGLGMITGLGATVEAVYNAVSASIDCFDNSGYVNEAHLPVRMALVPHGALPELSVDIPFCGAYSRWDKHLLQLSHAAITEATLNLQVDEPIPLVLACPEHYPQWPHQLPSAFIAFLSQQCGIPFCPHQSRILHIGRAGVVDAIDVARRLLAETDAQTVLVGGVDSYQRPALLHGLLDEGRIAGEGVLDGFTPGEGAGFILLSNDPKQALGNDQFQLFLGPAGTGQELGHRYSDEPYRGEGLAQAVKLAVLQHSSPKISHVYSSMNGENFWAKELAVALTRIHKHLIDDKPDIEHPADCYGDLGAASGALLIGLSAQKLLEQVTEGVHLVCCSSDQTYRSAITVCKERKLEITQEAK